MSSCVLEERLSIDEMMVPFKQRSSMKQYIMGIPHARDLKVWLLAGASGYMYDFEVHQSSSSTQNVASREIWNYWRCYITTNRNYGKQESQIVYGQPFYFLPVATKVEEKLYLCYTKCPRK